MGVEIANESGTSVDETALASLAAFVLERMGVSPLAELSVLLVDEGYMSSLHERWMGEPGPTDVLAFPMDELETDRGRDEDLEPRAALLGDVVLCPAVASRQARSANHTMQDELHLLATHGILHLLGYDHADPAEEQEMFGLQGTLLSDWQSRGTVVAEGGRSG